jgi:predicted transcriptional regulator
MPLMGAARTGPGKTTVAQDMEKADPPKVDAVLSDALRAAKVSSADEELIHLATTQGSIRDRTGKIKRAKFHAAVLALRWEGFSPKQTAEILGCSHARVSDALLRLREAASMDDQIDRIDQLIVPLAVDNLARGVMDGDRAYTLKVLDGRGVFRTHKSVEGTIKKHVLIMTVKTEMPAHLSPDSIPMPAAGSIIGAPLLPAPRVIPESEMSPK